MLRITIELIPHGDEKRTRPIGHAVIRNASELHCAKDGDYEMAIYSSVPPGYTRSIHSEISNHERKFSYKGLWRLVRTMLEAMKELDNETS